MAVARLTLSRPATTEAAPQKLSDEVELYQRTYTTLLRSSGETRLRVLESSHMRDGLLAAPARRHDELDLGAFIYAIRRLPDSDRAYARSSSWARRRALFTRAGLGPLEEWDAVEAPGAAAALVRRRRRVAGRAAGLGVGRRRPRADARRLPDRVEQDPPAHAWPPAGRRVTASTAEACAAALGGAADDWARLADAWGAALEDRLQVIAERG